MRFKKHRVELQTTIRTSPTEVPATRHKEFGIGSTVRWSLGQKLAGLILVFILIAAIARL